MTNKITACLWFDGLAEEAANFYQATFPDSHVHGVHRAPADFPGGKEGDVLTVDFSVLGMDFLGLNGGPEFKFDLAVSFIISTEDQAETDRYWNAIIDGGGSASECGWCKDKFGLSWQITPRRLTELFNEGGERGKRAFEAMMTMSKIDIAKLDEAAAGAKADA